MLCALASATLAPGSSAANLERSTITEMVKDVMILNPVTKEQRPAHLHEVFTAPNVLRTGPDSRAEMVSEDQTVTRVGANTLFSFEPGKREINLQRGSVLFNSPSGKGGGTIKTAAATAAVLGTTLIVTTTPAGGFKVLLVEGHGEVKTKGKKRRLGPGQMTFVLPGQVLGPVYNYQLSQQVGTSKLVAGFKGALPSKEKIARAVETQQRQIDKGEMVTTGLLAGTEPGEAYKIDSASLGALFAAVGADDPRLDQADGAGGEGDQAALAAAAEGERFANALVSDVIIDGSELTAEYLFALNSQQVLDSNPPAAFANTNGYLFLTNSAMFDTPSIDITSLAGSEVRLLAIDSINFKQSLSIQSDPAARISFVAGSTITAAPSTLVTLNAAAVDLIAFGSGFDLATSSPDNAGSFSDAVPLDFTDFELVNDGGSIQVVCPSLSLTNSGLSAGSTLVVRSEGTVQLAHNITDNAAWATTPVGMGGPIPVSDTSFSAKGTALEAVTSINVSAAQDIMAFQSDFVSPSTTLVAGNELKLVAVRFSDNTFNASLGSVNLQAKSLIDINGAHFQVANVAMTASTIVLRNVNFANNSNVTLKAQTPILNIGSVFPVSGQVNFLGNVTYNNVLILSGPGSPGTGHEIYDSSLNPTGHIKIK